MPSSCSSNPRKNSSPDKLKSSTVNGFDGTQARSVHPKIVTTHSDSLSSRVDCASHQQEAAIQMVHPPITVMPMQQHHHHAASLGIQLPDGPETQRWPNGCVPGMPNGLQTVQHNSNHSSASSTVGIETTTSGGSGATSEGPTPVPTPHTLYNLAPYSLSSYCPTGVPDYALLSANGTGGSTGAGGGLIIDPRSGAYAPSMGPNTALLSRPLVYTTPGSYGTVCYGPDAMHNQTMAFSQLSLNAQQAASAAVTGSSPGSMTSSVVADPSWQQMAVSSGAPMGYIGTPTAGLYATSNGIYTTPDNLYQTANNNDCGSTIDNSASIERSNAQSMVPTQQLGPLMVTAANELGTPHTASETTTICPSTGEVIPTPGSIAPLVDHNSGWAASTTGAPTGGHPYATAVGQNRLWFAAANPATGYHHPTSYYPHQTPQHLINWPEAYMVPSGPGGLVQQQQQQHQPPPQQSLHRSVASAYRTNGMNHVTSNMDRPMNCPVSADLTSTVSNPYNGPMSGRAMYASPNATSHPQAAYMSPLQWQQLVLQAMWNANRSAAVNHNPALNASIMAAAAAANRNLAARRSAATGVPIMGGTADMHQRGCSPVAGLGGLILSPLELDLTLMHRARYYVIKSDCDFNVEQAIRYNVWCSTRAGNQSLNEAFQSISSPVEPVVHMDRGGAISAVAETSRASNLMASEMSSSRPGHVLLFFSVRSSGYLSGVAEMIGSVDLQKRLRIWQDSRFVGEIPIRWLYVKRVPNGLLKHICIEAYDNRSVTTLRDTSEILPAFKGEEMLRIVHNYSAQQPSY